MPSYSPVKTVKFLASKLVRSIANPHRKCWRGRSLFAAFGLLVLVAVPSVVVVIPKPEPGVGSRVRNSGRKCWLPSKLDDTSEWSKKQRLWRHVANNATDWNAGGRWQHMMTSTNHIAAYSAFYDDRLAVRTENGSVWVRILGIARVTNSMFTCAVWYRHCDTDSPYITPAVVDFVGRKSGYNMNGFVYLQYLFSCRLPDSSHVPTRVSLLTDDVVNDARPQSLIYLPVEIPERLKKESPGHPESDSGKTLMEFGACVAISFGSVPTAEFVEWMEFGRLLGIAEFNVYDAGMTGMTDVFQYYTSKGWLTVRSMPPPVTAKSTSPSDTKQTSLDAIKLASAASLNDCLLRNMYRYRYVVVIDFDEFILPRHDSDYSQLLLRIDKYYQRTQAQDMYTFRNSYFLLPQRPDESQPATLRTMQYRIRINISPSWFVPKSFINPRSCLSIFNHYCLLPLSTLPQPQPIVAPKDVAKTGRSMSVWRDVQFLEVDPNLATSHHYRTCVFTANRCKALQKHRTKDDTALRFKERLQPAVEQALKDISDSQHDNT